MSASSSHFAIVVSPRFCSPCPIELTFFQKPSWLKKSITLAVTDVNGNLIFQVESRTWSLRNRQVVFDGSGKPVISMKEKMLSLHDRWKVFIGDGSDSKDVLFTVKRNSMLQQKTELDVFLAANTKEEVVDYKIKGSYSKKTCTVYKGDSSIVVAQMSKGYKCVKRSESDQAFGVTVNPNMDHSFITALVIILGQLDEDEGEAHSKKKSKKVKIAGGGKKGERKEEGKGEVEVEVEVEVEGKEEEEEEEGEEEVEEEEEEEEEENEEEGEEEVAEEEESGIAEVIVSIAEAIFS